MIKANYKNNRRTLNKAVLASFFGDFEHVFGHFGAHDSETYDFMNLYYDSLNLYLRSSFFAIFSVHTVFL